MRTALTRRTALEMATAGIGAGLVAACAPGAGGGQVTTGGKGAQITIWRGSDYIPEVNAYLKEMWDQYAKEKEIKVTLEEKSGNWNDQLIAAVQAGTPPDIVGVFDYQTQYWRSQGQTIDVTDLVTRYRGLEGGFFDYVNATTMHQGRYYGVPLAVNAWPFHVRQDILDKQGGKWPDSWDQFRAISRAVTRAPDFYAYGMTLGRTNDTNNHFLGTLWTFGGKLQNDDGSLAVDARNSAWLETLSLVKKMYEEDKIIPPGAINWDDAANNNAYQGEQIAWTSNPTSIYTWLARNNKLDILKATKFYPYPKGPAGQFGQVDVWAHVIFKASKAQAEAKGALEYVLKPERYKTYIENLKGRFLPVYKNFVDLPMWKENPAYAEYGNIAKNGRIMAYSSSPSPAYSDITTKFLIGDMMQDLLVKKQTPQQALQTFVEAAKAIYERYRGR